MNQNAHPQQTTKLTFSDVRKFILGSQRPLAKLVNCGASCYLDSVLSIVVGAPNNFILDCLFQSELKDDKWSIQVRMSVANCVASSTLMKGFSYCDLSNIRDVISQKYPMFARNVCNDPAEFLHCLADACPKMQFKVQVPNGNEEKHVWNEENWPFCLSSWLNHNRFRALYDHDLLIVDAKDKGYADFNFIESFPHCKYHLIGVIQRRGIHYFSIFVTRDFLWVEYDDARPGLYRPIQPTKETLCMTIDVHGNGSVLYFYSREEAIVNFQSLTQFNSHIQHTQR